jgi:uncharacterized membrane protein YedE/YeeE
MRTKIDISLVAAGILVGILNLIFYLLLSPHLLGQSAGLSVGGPLGTSVAWLEETATGKNRIWSGLPPVLWPLVPGILVGALASAVQARRLTWRTLTKAGLNRKQCSRALFGGLLAGFGVFLADGCLVKHALTGLPGLSLESVSVVVGIIAGIWLAMKVEERSEG